MISLKIAFMLVALGLTLTAWTQPSPESSSARVPILVELFTSEGCSSCPPADVFLQKLDRQPIPGAQMIVLSEHVDYWDHDGWRDPNSSHLLTERQTIYARRLTSDQVYTPQMVVDGAGGFVGTSQTKADAAFKKALNSTKVNVQLSSVTVDSADALRAHVEVPALSAGIGRSNAEVYVAIALDHVESQVSAGENNGRRLTHTAVVQNLTKIGSVRREQGLIKDIQLKLTSRMNSGSLRLVAFIQEPDQGRVLGATVQSVGAKP
jgi:hypothetical protein